MTSPSNGETAAPNLSPPPPLDDIPSKILEHCKTGDLNHVQALFHQYQFAQPPPQAPLHQVLEDSYGPIYQAIIHGHAAIVSFLLDQGFSLTPRLVSHAVYDPSIPIFEAFLQHGWDINAPTSSGGPVIRNLVSEIPIMHWLLTHGADPNIPDNRGRTALGAAACELDPPHIQMLLDHGAKLELGDALHAAAGTFAGDLGRIEMMQYLLAQGADINQREVGYDSVLADKYPGLGGKTPLHNAVRRWNQDIVGFLLGRGADPNIKDNSGRTPLDIAEGLKDVEMVALLKGYQDIQARQGCNQPFKKRALL